MGISDRLCLFGNKVYDLIRYINLFYKSLAFQEGSYSLVLLRQLKSFLFRTAVRNYDGSANLTVNLDTDFYGVLYSLALFIFRPLGKGK